MEIYVNNNSSLSIEEKFKYGKNAWSDKGYYEAELLITDCAEQGDAEAQYILGESKGNNGIEWLLKAAQQNNLKAMESLCCCGSDCLGEKDLLSVPGHPHGSLLLFASTAFSSYSSASRTSNDIAFVGHTGRQSPNPSQ